MINKCHACICLLVLGTACLPIPVEQYSFPPAPTTTISPNFEFVVEGFERFEEVEPGPEPCGYDKMAEVLEPASDGNDYAIIDCDLNLEPGQRITKRLIFEGADATGVTLNCNFATIGSEFISTLDEEGGLVVQLSPGAGKDRIEVRSHFDGESETFVRPENIVIKNCNIIGSVRVWGMGKNGQGTKFLVDGEEINYYKISSETRGHTERARDNAPTNIVFDNVTIFGTGRNPFYFAPGVTFSKLINSELKGKSDAVGLYLDAESYGNTIRSNYIHVDTKNRLFERWDRPLIAIDGSSHNKIIDNRFSSLNHGGIYLYRNCGENGVVRHATPSHNIIVNNVFYYNKYQGGNPAVYLGARDCGWWQETFGYCSEDNGFGLGSSISNKDHATHNVVMQNQIIKRSVEDMIKTKNKEINSPNFVNYNTTVTEDTVEYYGFAGCYVSEGYKDFILHGETIDVFKDDNGQLACFDYEYTCNDGDLIPSPSSSCEFTEVLFDCAVSGDNAGCEQFISCPPGQRILTAVAACNLEWGTVSDAALENVPAGHIKVVRASDNVSSGSCYVGSNTLAEGEEQIIGIDALFFTGVGCDEYDENGGDCQIRGVLYCR